MNGPHRLPDRFQLIALDTVDSTNDEAKSLARRKQAPDGTIVWALEQTAGRGRNKRGWISKPGNLYCSVILRPIITPALAGQLGFVVALAACSALEATNVKADRISCKWPNDVLIDGMKICGILLEAETKPGDTLEWLIAGCGINLAHYPSDTPFTATSLAKATGQTTDPAVMLLAYANALTSWLNIWECSGFNAIRDAWLAHAHGLKAPIEVRLGNERFCGEFSDLDGEGALILNCDGVTRRVTTGDVFFGPQMDLAS